LEPNLPFISPFEAFYFKSWSDKNGKEKCNTLFGDVDQFINELVMDLDLD